MRVIEATESGVVPHAAQQEFLTEGEARSVSTLVTPPGLCSGHLLPQEDNAPTAHGEGRAAFVMGCR